MKTPNKSFFPKMNGFPVLFLDHILVEHFYPVLFTCYSDDGGYYVVSCHRADGTGKEWIVTQTTPNKVIELLKNHISIRSLFEEQKEVKYIVTLDSHGKYSCSKKRLQEIPQEILPTPNCYMDPEPDEFKDEIESLQMRAPYKIVHIQYEFKDEFELLQKYYYVVHIQFQFTSYKKDFVISKNVFKDIRTSQKFLVEQTDRTILSEPITLNRPTIGDMLCVRSNY